MARYTGAVCRQCRRENQKLFLKGDRCYSDKCALARRSFVPGQHGQNQARKKVSEYGLQLRAKQKAKRYYGVLESQFAHYFEMAERKSGITGENLLRILESRLDNIVYRAGFAMSRKEARQLVLHRHFTKATITSNSTPSSFPACFFIINVPPITVSPEIFPYSEYFYFTTLRHFSQVLQ